MIKMLTEIGLLPHFVIRHYLNMDFKKIPPEFYTLNGYV